MKNNKGEKIDKHKTKNFEKKQKLLKLNNNFK